MQNEADERVVGQGNGKRSCFPAFNGGGFLLFRIGLLLSILTVVWLPELLHSNINRTLVSAEVVTQSKIVPEIKVLDEVARMDYAAGASNPGETPSQSAEAILSGWFHAPKYLNAPIKLKGYPADFMTGPPTFQLAMASMEVERTLLDAFENTRDERFLQLALTRTLELASHEKAQLFDEAFLWNDHAIASRITVLTALWKNIRGRTDISYDSSRAILSFVSRSGSMLAKSERFTVRTNHGVMQNLALLKIGAAFPAIPDAAVWKTLAIDRLMIQLPFFISKEGVVLEHSAGYHFFGAKLIEMAIRLSVLNGMDVDQRLLEANEKTHSVLADFVRPDGSLPAFGDTNVSSLYKSSVARRANNLGPQTVVSPENAKPTNATRLYPLSGYAIWSFSGYNEAVQTAIVWAKHDGHGHKHADELSVLFWSGGVNWLTSTGYWPYGDRNTEWSISWNASNAPHELGEPANSPRTIKLLATGSANELRMLDIARYNANGAKFRRQVIQIGENILLIVDFSHSVAAGTEILWTLDPALQLSVVTPGSDFLTSRSPEGRRLNISVAPQPDVLSLYRGSEQPVAGWVALDGRPTPADALRIIRNSPEAVTASVFRVMSGDQTTSQSIRLNPDATPDNWSLYLAFEDEGIKIERHGAELNVRKEASRALVNQLTTLNLNVPDNVDASILELKQAYSTAVSVYPPWQDWLHYRIKLSYLICMLGILIELVLLAAARLAKSLVERHRLVIHLSLVLGWTGLCCWIVWVYFA